jgi:hypothetical protein
MTVFVYGNTGKQVRDRDHLGVFANGDAAEAWSAKNDPEALPLVRGNRRARMNRRSITSRLGTNAMSDRFL